MSSVDWLKEHISLKGKHVIESPITYGRKNMILLTLHFNIKITNNA